MNEEKVLSFIPQELFKQINNSKISNDKEALFNKLLEISYWLPRSFAESEYLEGRVLHVSSYATILGKRGILIYRRKSKNENKLEGKLSIGIGGHTKQRDILKTGAFSSFRQNAIREVREEMLIKRNETWLAYDPIKYGDAVIFNGTLRFTSHEVDLRHFGLWWIVNVDDKEVKMNETEATECFWSKDIKKVDYNEFESWSKNVIRQQNINIQAKKIEQLKTMKDKIERLKIMKDKMGAISLN